MSLLNVKYCLHSQHTEFYNLFIMAIGLFKLNKSQRKTLSVIFMVLNIIQVLFGVIILGGSIYVCVAIAPMIRTEKAEIMFLFIVYAIFGAYVAINWLIGLKICSKCFNQAHKKSTKSLLLLWTCAGTNTIISLIIIAHMSIKVNKHIIKSMQNSIRGAMKTYLKDMESKETIDRVQYELKCCGADSYKDWYDIEWMDDSIINTKSSTVKELRYDANKLYLPVIPWSCCNVDFPVQCLHDPIQQTSFTNVWVDEPNTVTESLNIDGCVTKMKAPVGVIVEGFSAIIAGLTILHIITTMVSRILYTSCRNAILLYDPEGIAPGWIFGRGDCGYARGKTLTEIMGITTETLEQRIIEEKQREKNKSKETTTPKKSNKSEDSEHTAITKGTSLLDKAKNMTKKKSTRTDKTK